MSESYLGFRIDSSQASSAAADLDRLTAAATRTQGAADKLEAEAASLGGALGRAAEGAGKLKQPVDSLGRSFGAQDEHVRAFRMEVERLTMKYQPLAQATKQYEATVSEINRAHQLGVINTQQMTTALDRERLAYERLKTSATTAGAAVKAANTNVRTGAMGSERAAGINAGYQFQDIAVTAAMGMNPLMIGLQQGTQLASVLSSMERPVSGLAAAFTSLVSPVTLVTVGLTAGVSALVQYFMTASSGAEDTKKLFEEQNEVIRRAADLWGDAAPALKAYVDELDRADKITQGREAGEILAGRSLEGLSEDLDGVNREFILLMRSLQGVGADPAFIRDFRDAFGDLRERLDDGTASIGDLNAAQRQLTAAVANYGTKEVLTFRDAWDKVTASIFRGVEAAREARSEWIKAIAGGTNVQDILSGATFTENGRTYQSGAFAPTGAIPVPGRRPSDLAGDPDPLSILNSDGRLTGVPVPGQKPNFFELEQQKDKVDDVTKAYQRAQEAQAEFWLDLGFQERQAGRSPIDQQVASTLTRYGFNENLNSPEANALRSQLELQQQREMARDAIGGFFSDFRSELLESGGNIGKSLGNAILNALTNALDKAAQTALDRMTNILVNALFGTSAGGAPGAASGGALGSVASTVLGGGLTAANSNAPAAARPTGDIASYITDAAIKRGIDPDVALRVARSEGGLDSWNMRAGYVKNGFREPSYGPFQLLKGGAGTGFPAGLGNDFMARTGLDPALAANGPAGVDFALDHASRNGWGAWYGAAKAGIGDWQGIGTGTTAVDAVNKLAESADAATKGLDTFGGGLGSVGNALSAAGSQGGGGGGLLSILGGLGGQWGAAKAGLLKPGLFASGTPFAPGGPSIVGERGPELLDLPQGSNVVSNHKLMAALAQSGGQGGGGNTKVDVGVSVDNNGNLQAYVKSVSEGTSKNNLAAYRKDQQRAGFGNDQKIFSSRKG
ncbi:tail length tape measure protein [Rhizobium subbaraonis]|uniref:Tail length tape measure protein n=1 Tax=Rhizobium subbaraonis TaxID=908946 RepID=A0A285UVD4_9HYPH|nr:phage tail length tape measure family protein [Rhizobium subbaraonis]SOC45769.1 tail length tape measure protein [Rhizobium subbaraonis]